MAKIVYPLEQVYTIKKDRVKKAEKAVEEKKAALTREQNKLKEVEAARDRVRKHHEEKLQQLRDSFDEGTTSEQVLQKKSYLKVVEGKLTAEEEKVVQQKKQVTQAEKRLEEAKKELKLKRLEEEKIKMHKELWEKEEKVRLSKEEAKEQEEIGQAMHEAHKRRREE